MQNKFQARWLSSNDNGQNRQEYKIIHLYVWIYRSLSVCTIYRLNPSWCLLNEVRSLICFVPEPRRRSLLPVLSLPSPPVVVSFGEVGVSSFTSEQKRRWWVCGWVYAEKVVVSLVSVGTEATAGCRESHKIVLVWSLMCGVTHGIPVAVKDDFQW